MKNVKEKSQWLTQSAWTLVRSESRELALPSAVVELSTLAPKIHGLPFAPKHIRGIAHINGEVMPCIDLAQLLGGKGNTGSEEALIISCDDRKVLLLVDQAVRQLTLTEADSEHISVMESEEDQDTVVLAEWTLGGSNIFLLDPVFLTHFAAQRRHSAGRPGLIADHDEGDPVLEQEQQLDNLYLYVGVGNQHFALPVLECREIVDLAKIAPIPGASEAICGLSLIRNVSYLVVDAAISLSISSDQRSQAVIVNVGDEQVLLAVAAIESVRAVARHQVRRVGGADALLSAVIEVPGEPLRAVISPSQLGNRIADMQRYIPDRANAGSEHVENIRTRRFLLVRWMSELFAMDLEGVDCLAPPTRVRPVNSDKFIGMINIDGDVLPVLESECFYGSKNDSKGGEADAEGFVIFVHKNLRFAVLLEQAEAIIDVDERDIQKSRAGGDDRFTATLRFNQQLISQISLQHFSALVQDNLESPE